MPDHPLIIGHRGACGYLPEHTLASFQLAVDLGADAVETDIVVTRDGQLLCRHDCELSITTDVAAHREFASRRQVRRIEGVDVDGWFTPDFTLEEIGRLRARERFDFRDHSHDGQFPLLSLDELLQWAAGQRMRRGRPLGVIIEIKHAAFFESNGYSVDEAVVQAMDKFSLAGADSSAFVESFEIDILRRLSRRIQTPLIQLLDAAPSRPADENAVGEATTYGDLITPAGLAEIATYARAIGPWKRLIVPEQLEGTSVATSTRLGAPTPLIADAHAAGLAVHTWTFRSEPRFLTTEYAGDPLAEYRQFASLGVDGLISDFPDAASKSLL
ncbi:MAG TPA: glycerophosphodiester phosphodiesterase family protein [Tepidisphaeraceae bacterium]|jgi:glycerophosphoryl diester phosphodiesterase|nr:glycerophosphodiester phosphodiesterase family protein [Tepidisphaeraceae bacterium]